MSSSTALQEFFGVGITEAVAAGAHPVLRDRLVYPERIADFGADPEQSLYASSEHAVALTLAAFGRDSDVAPMHAARSFSWDRVAPRYDEVLERLARAESVDPPDELSIDGALDPLDAVVGFDEPDRS